MDLVCRGMHIIHTTPTGGRMFVYTRRTASDQRTTIFFNAPRVVSVCASHDGSVFSVDDAGGLWMQNRAACDGKEPEAQAGSAAHASATSVVVVRLPLPSRVAGVYDASIVSCGGMHTLVLTTAGNVLANGAAEFVGLGCGVQDESTGAVASLKTIPRDSFQMRRITAIATGHRHSVGLDECKCVWTWGLGMSGCLGHGDVLSRAVPTLVQGLGESAFISAGGYHTMAGSVDGARIFAWGAGRNGQLGVLVREACLQPTQVRMPDGVRVARVACALWHSLFLSDSGTLFASGEGRDGLLGLGLQSAYVPTRVPSARFGDMPLARIAASNCISAALTVEGELYVWGAGMQTGVSGDAYNAIGDTLHMHRAAHGIPSRMGDWEKTPVFVQLPRGRDGLGVLLQFSGSRRASTVDASPPSSALVSSVGTKRPRV